MLSKLIKILGGFTSEEHSELTEQLKRADGNYEQWRARCERVEKKNEELKEEVKLKNERIDVMIELYINTTKRNAISDTPPPKQDPIKTLPMSWPRMKRVLEKKEQSNAKVS